MQSIAYVTTKDEYLIPHSFVSYVGSITSANLESSPPLQTESGPYTAPSLLI